jgi:hypothetical protein
MRQAAIFLLFILLFCKFYNCSAQLSFKATLSPTVISLDETTELKLVVEGANNVEDITPPSLAGFTIIKGPSKDMGSTTANKKIVPYVSITYTLKPKKADRFNFAPTTAFADGQLIKGNSLQLLVKNSQLSNANNETDNKEVTPDFILAKGENLVAKLKNNMFLLVNANKTTCFVGEPILVTYKLYTKLKSTSNVIKGPAFNGFSTVDLLKEESTDYKPEKLNGILYNVYLLRKVQLYPLQAGTIELEALETDNTIKFIKDEFVDPRYKNAGELMWDALTAILPPEAIQTEKQVLISEKKTITVKPLPTTTQPFIAAVGNFSIFSTIDKIKFTTDEVATISVTLTGAGNLNLISLPNFNWPIGIDSSTPLVTDELNKASMPISGTKTYDFKLIIDKAGNYVFPAISFCFFNPSKATYTTILTLPISFVVAKGDGVKKTDTILSITKPAQEQFFDTIFTKRWLIVLPIALIVLSTLFFWIKKDMRKQQGATIAVDSERVNADLKNEVESFTNPFEESEQHFADVNATAFYGSINKEFKQYLHRTLDIKDLFIDKDAIQNGLLKKNIDTTLQEKILQVLNEIELQHYTPFADSIKMEEIYNKVKEIQQALT